MIALTSLSTTGNRDHHSSHGPEYHYQDGAYRRSTGAGSQASIKQEVSRAQSHNSSGHEAQRVRNGDYEWASRGSRKNLSVEIGLDGGFPSSGLDAHRRSLQFPPTSAEVTDGRRKRSEHRRSSILLVPVEEMSSAAHFNLPPATEGDNMFDRFLGRNRDVPVSERGVWNVLIHPLSPFWQAFQTISGLLLLYSTSITPFLIAFYSEQEGHCGHPPTIEMDVFVDTFFMLEILCNFITGKEDEEHGYYLHRISEVSSKYLRSNFAVDIISALPFGWAEFSAPDISCDDQEGSSFLSYLRLVRMLRMLRLLKVLKIFNVLRQFFRLSPNVIRFLKSAFTVCMTAHLGGCIWWFIHVLQGPDHLEHIRFAWHIEPTVASAYLSCQYYMLATLCTVGYGDISADTDPERVFALFVMLLGATVFAIIISNMSALVKELVSKESILLEEQDMCIDYMRKHGHFPVLEARVRKFYRFRILQDRHNFLENQLLDSLPHQLASPIRVIITRQLLGRTPLFQHMSDEFMDEMLKRLEVNIYAPGESLFEAGEDADAMFVVMTGEVEVREPGDGTGQLLMTVRQGEILGEVEMIQGIALRHMSANAKGFVEARILSLDNFTALSHDYPDVHNRLVALVSSSPSYQKLRRTSSVEASQSHTPSELLNLYSMTAHNGNGGAGVQLPSPPQREQGGGQQGARGGSPRSSAVAHHSTTSNSSGNDVMQVGGQAARLARQRRVMSSPALGLGLSRRFKDQFDASGNFTRASSGKDEQQTATVEGLIREEPVKEHDGPAPAHLPAHREPIAFRKRRSLSARTSSSRDAAAALGTDEIQATLHTFPMSRRTSIMSGSDHGRGERRGSGVGLGLGTPLGKHAPKFWGSSVTERQKPLLEKSESMSRGAAAAAAAAAAASAATTVQAMETANIRSKLDDLSDELSTMLGGLKQNRIDRRAARAEDEERRLMEREEESSDAGSGKELQRQMDRMSQMLMSESRWSLEMGRMERSMERMSQLVEEARSGLSKLQEPANARSPSSLGGAKGSGLKS